MRALKGSVTKESYDEQTGPYISLILLVMESFACSEGSQYDIISLYDNNRLRKLRVNGLSGTDWHQCGKILHILLKTVHIECTQCQAIWISFAAFDNLSR